MSEGMQKKKKEKEELYVNLTPRSSPIIDVFFKEKNLWEIDKIMAKK